MTLLELGEALRQAREHRNLSQDDIAVRLKLTSAMVQSIETGNLEGLPHLVYARGFIKAYASMMGIPADALHDAFEPLEEKEETFEPVRTRKDWMPIHKNFTFGADKAVILCVVAVILLAFWFRQPIMDTLSALWPTPAAEKNEPAPQPKSQEPAPTPSQPKPTGELAPLSQSSTAVAQATQTRPLPEPSAAPQAPVQPVHQPTPQAASTGSAAPAPQPQEQHNVPPQAAQEPHVIVLSARATCWVSARPSNGPIKNVIMKKGDQLTLSFDEKMALKFGNVGGVDITFDGTPLPPQGISGQVKTLTFPPIH